MPYSKYIVSHTGDLGTSFGYQRAGIHRITLLPGKRTSRTHAESHEEEFVFVISGSPHVWINGFVYKLFSNCAVGFPAGTGIAHTFINNSETPVELLVVGEKTKKENLCFFPLNPEQEKESTIWWANAPEHDLGPHNGLAGPVKLTDIGKNWPSCIVDCTTLSRLSGFHYPGDSETFGEYAPLAKTLGLKAFGIGYEYLAHGRRSSFPHAHKVEEEFAFILSGNPKVFLNGYVYQAKAGDSIAFPSGTGIAHCLINDSDEPIHFVMVGEPQNIQDKIIYSNNDFRNIQCQIKKFFWENSPKDLPFGPHDGKPQLKYPNHLSLRTTDSTEEAILLELFKGSSTYFANVEGGEPSLETVRQYLIDGPKNKSETYRKEFLVIKYEGKSIGVVDLHFDHPTAVTTYLGFLMIVDGMCGKGLGRRSYELVEHYAKSVFGTKHFLLGVNEHHSKSGFWQTMGFTPSGKTYSYSGENKTSNVVEYSKTLPE